MRTYFRILLILGCPFSSSGDPTIADPETTTSLGCKCTSLCGATIEDGFVVSYKTKVVFKLCNVIYKNSTNFRKIGATQKENVVNIVLLGATGITVSTWQILSLIG